MSVRSSLRSPLISGAVSNGAVALWSGANGLLMSSTNLPIVNLGNGTFTAVTSSVTGAQNNLSIGVTGNTYCEWSGASDATITGISGGASGKTLVIKNTGSSVSYFAHNSGSSSSGNKFQNLVTSSTTAVAPGGAISYFHNGTDWIYLTHEQGAYISVAFNASNFALTGDRTLTVDSGDQSTYAWKLSGRTLTVIWILNTLTISGGTSSTALTIAIPNSYTSTVGIVLLSVFWLIAGTTYSGIAQVDAAGTVIYTVKLDLTDIGAGTNNIYDYGSMTFEIT